ncbi:C39 family peptidase [Leptospira sp. WS92.C1]
MQKELFGAFTSGDEYKYLRDAGYEFRVSGDSISGYRQIQSGDIAIDGNAMKAESYSPVLEFQYITIQTRFDPGNLSTTMLGDLNSTSFSANLVQNVRDSLSSMQEQMEKMFAEFQDKTAELQTLHAYNQQIQEYQETRFKEIKKNVVAAFQGLEPGFQKNFKPAMSGMKEYHTEASRYNFEEGSFGSQSSKMQSAFDGIRNAGGVYNGSRELKGSVNIKGIPVEVSYGMQDLLILSNFELGALDYDFNLKGTGTSFAQEQLTTINVKYQTYVQDVQQRIEEQAKANDAEKESKGFIFTIMNGMNTGSGSMSQRFTQSVQGELQSRVTGALAEATGLPASFVGALVGGSSMEDAFQAFQKQTITSEISKATGIPEWVISGQMDKMNQKKEEFYETQEFQMAVSVVAIVAAPFTGGASLAAAMAVNATIGAAQGAAGGGLEGALVGAVGGAVSGYVQSISGGSVNVGLSYSKENGFGASVSVGYGPAAVSVGVSEHGGATVGLGLQYKGLNAGLNYNSKTGSVDGNIGFSMEGGGSLALSYSEGSGVGFNAGLNSSKGIGANVGWSEKDGFGGGLSYGLPGEGKWSGTGANINWTQNGGTNIALTAGAGEKYGADGVSRGVVPGMNNAAKFGSGGTTAGTWSSEGGFQANKNFINDKWAQDYLADAEDRREDQENHNQHAGADVLSALGTRRREDEGSNVAVAQGEADVPNLLDSAFDAVGDAVGSAWNSVSGAVSSAWGNAKSALGFGPDKVVMMPIGDSSPFSSMNNFLEAYDNKTNGSGKFETKEQRILRESEAHQKLVDNFAGTDRAIQEKYGSRIASSDEVAAHYGNSKEAQAYMERSYFLKDDNGNIVGKILKDSAYENQTGAQFRDATRGINKSNICSLASSAGMLMSEGIPQRSPGQRFADELAGGFVERISSSEAQKPSGRITKTFEENVEIYSGGTKKGKHNDPEKNLEGAYTDSGRYGNNDKIKSLLDRGIPVMASTKLTSSGHITYIVGYDNSKSTWITHDPNGDKNRPNYGRQEPTAGRAIEYGQNTHGIGDRRIYWMENK